MNKPMQDAGPTQRPFEEHNFKSHDQAELFYRYWPAPVTPQHNKPIRAIVIFHRGHEHSGRVAHLPEELQMPGTAFFAWDTRGLGRSSGERGHATSLAELTRDMDCFSATLPIPMAISPMRSR